MLRARPRNADDIESNRVSIWRRRAITAALTLLLWIYLYKSMAKLGLSHQEILAALGALALLSAVGDLPTKPDQKFAEFMGFDSAESRFVCHIFLLLLGSGLLVWALFGG
jgi:hypothetical protein